MIRRALFSAVVAGPLVLSGCLADATGPSTGTYELVRVDRNLLPAVLLQTGDDKVEVTEGQFNLNYNLFEYDFSYTLVTTTSGRFTRTTVTDKGSWDVEDGQFVTLRSIQGGGLRDARWWGSGIFFNLEGVRFLFSSDPPPDHL